NEVAKLKNFTDAQRQDLLARFYTDLNVDGRFMTLGSNVWGLERWYPVVQTTEKSLAESRKRDLEEEDEDFYDEELDSGVEEEVRDDIYDDIGHLEYNEEQEKEYAQERTYTLSTVP